MRIRDLSLRQNVPVKQGARILRELANAGLVTLARGPGGGYLVDEKMLDLYTLMDLIQAVARGLYTRPKPPNKTCADVRACLAGAVRKVATEITFRMIVEGT